MYESNGPEVKIRGNASHIAEKYLQLARDAQSSGDPIAAENYYQHAEHYFRMIAAAQEHLRQTQPSSYYQQQPQQGGGGNYSDDSFDDGDGDQPAIGGEPYAPQQQPFYPREQQGQPQHHQQPQHQQPQQYPQPQQQPQFQPRQQHYQPSHNDDDVERLPSFITGGQPQPGPQQAQAPNGPNGPMGQNNQNGQNGYDGSADRFPLHRRRRRHRGPRDHMSGEADAPSSGGPQIDE
jgi:Domain of unknown function (DUF4167)